MNGFAINGGFVAAKRSRSRLDVAAMKQDARWEAYFWHMGVEDRAARMTFVMQSPGAPGVGLRLPTWRAAELFVRSVAVAVAVEQPIRSQAPEGSAQDVRC